jgi:hypothetical protein
MKVIFIAASAKQMINVWKHSWALIILVEILNLLLKDFDQRKLLEPNVIEFVCEDE